MEGRKMSTSEVEQEPPASKVEEQKCGLHGEEGSSSESD